MDDLRELTGLDFVLPTPTTKSEISEDDENYNSRYIRHFQDQISSGNQVSLRSTKSKSDGDVLPNPQNGSVDTGSTPDYDVSEYPATDTMDDEPAAAMDDSVLRQLEQLHQHDTLRDRLINVSSCDSC